jgi:hypothetical protein
MKTFSWLYRDDLAQDHLQALNLGTMSRRGRNRLLASLRERYFADLAITATLVIPSAGAGIKTKQVIGETLTTGELVYIKPADKKCWLALCGGNSDQINVAGVTLNGGSAGQQLQYQYTGDVTIGATLTIGVEYYLSAAAGKICPRADLVSGNNVIRVGFGKTAAVLTLDIKNMGVMP